MSGPIGNMRSRQALLVSIVAPAYNEVENLPALCQGVTDVLEKENCRFEIVIVENGSNDGSIEVLRELHAKDPRVQYLRLSRNFGSQGGLVAGLEHCRGDVVITMDADLQHPAEIIPQLLEAWETGFDIVNTRRVNNYHDGALRLVMNNIYFWIMKKSTGIPMSTRQSDFRLFDREALNALLDLPERNKFLRGLTHWIGFRQFCIDFVVARRHYGMTKHNFLDLLKLAATGVTSFSTLPLHFFFLLGLTVSLGSLLYGFVIGASYLLGQPMPSGFASLAIGVFFLGGVQLIGIGILGEYIGNIFNEARGRPPYILQETSVATSVDLSKNRSVKSTRDDA